MSLKVIRADGAEWEQIVACEILLPNTPNVYGDLMSPDAVRRAAYKFMEEGFAIDVNHDNVDVSDQVKVVESFIARAGDPDFIEGAWVVFVHILDPDLWQRVLDGEINGFSYEALVNFTPATLVMEDDGSRQGVTEPALDGHVHNWFAMVGLDNRPLGGGTDVVNGHSHRISTHTVTDEAADHVHRFNIVTGKNGK